MFGLRVKMHGVNSMNSEMLKWCELILLVCKAHNLLHLYAFEDQHVRAEKNNKVFGKLIRTPCNNQRIKIPSISIGCY